MLKTISAMFLDFGNYESRKVARLNAEDNGGIGVSTAHTSDAGYETALLDQNGVHPVERYGTREQAEAGHLKWVEFSKTNRVVTKLPDADGWLDPEQITLVPANP